MKDPAAVTTPARELADFAASLRFESIPPAVVDRTEDLFLNPKNPKTAEYIEGRYG